MIAVDARVVLYGANEAVVPPAITPYPGHYRQRFELPDGSFAVIRPILPQDHKKVLDMFREMKTHTRGSFEKLKDAVSPADADLLRRAEHSLAPSPHFFDFIDTLSLDYEKEISLVVVPEGQTEIFGIARLTLDRKSSTGSFAVAFPSLYRYIRSTLLHSLIAVAKSEKLKSINSVFAKDAHILRLAEELNFEIKSLDNGLVYIEKVIS